MHILNTETLVEQGNLTTAQLVRHISQGASFNATFPGFGFEQYEDGEEYSIVHQGREIFHGYLDTVQHSNAEGHPETSLTVLDTVAELAKITSQLQEEEVNLGSGGNGPNAGGTGRYNAMKRQTNMAVSLGSYLDGLKVRLHGKEYTFRVLEEAAAYAYVKRTDRVYSMLSIFQSIRSAHPDLSIFADEEAAEIIVGSTRLAENAELDTTRHAVRIDSVEPDFADVCKGVLVVLPNKNGDTDNVVYRVPSDVSIHEPCIKIIRASNNTSTYAVRQAFQFWNVASLLYHNCSVTLPMQQASGDELGKNLLLTGRGTAPQWGSMRAPVSSMTWDFVAQTVNLTSENALAEPDIPDNPDTPKDSDFPDTPTPPPPPDPPFPPDPGQSSDDSSGASSEEPPVETALEAYFLEPTEFEPLPSKKAFWLTLNWTANLPCTFSILVDDGKAPWVVTPDSPDSMKLELPYGRYRFVLTATTKSQPLQEAADEQTYVYDPVRTGEGGTRTGGLLTENTEHRPTEGKTFGPTHCGGCDCAEKWKALEVWKLEIERRIKALEDMSCDCASIIREEAAAVANALNLTANVNAVHIMTDDNGDKYADTTVTATTSGIDSDSHIHG